MERAQDVGNDPEREREEPQTDFGQTPPDDTVNRGQDREANLEDGDGESATEDRG